MAMPDGSRWRLEAGPDTEKFEYKKEQEMKRSVRRTGTGGKRNFSHVAIHIFTFLLMLSGVAAVIFFKNDFLNVHIHRMESPFGFATNIIGIALLGITLSFLAYLAILYIRYTSVKSVADNELPTCTVIVPAYNEGELVWRTLMSLVESNYPADKMQIIAIDDGSKDDTWDWIVKAKAVLGERLAIHKQPRNMGKRHALYHGFQEGTGAVFITVDSDSIVDKNTLRNLVSPFVTNEDCGAVAGNVRVLNNKKAIIPKMLNVSFAFSFEFVRSAQSSLGSVMCTPGALAAYKREAVMNCLKDWIGQTFMGKASDIGEDRAMTNMILKQGYHVLFQKDALVYTNTPEKYKNLYKMFIRWERSNVRENIMMSKFAFKNFRKGPKTGTRILLLSQWMKVILAYPMLLMMLYFVVSYPLLFVSSALATILVFSSVQVFFYAKTHNWKDSLWAYSYSIFYTFSLFWITPYAILTAGRSGWLTRSIS